jgi:spermidine synthase
VLWATLHGSAPDAIIAAEDGSGLSVLRRGEDGWAGETTVYANGLGQSHIPFPTHHVTLGLVPVMLHPDPREIAIVGLGSGATLYAAGGRHETRRISSIEIVAPQLETLRRLNDRRRDGGLASLLSDDRIAFTFADARTVIRLGGEKYDVIEADALRPTSAYAGNLYSVEYFTLLREHLKPRGFAVSWAPTQRVIDTFVSVFPHAMLYEQSEVRLLVGSNEPIAWDPAVVSERLRHDFSRAYYARAGVDVERYLREFASATPTMFDAEQDRATPPDLNTDLFPRDEFLVPRGS